MEATRQEEAEEWFGLEQAGRAGKIRCTRVVRALCGEKIQV
jgi:hypothetical protein